MHASRLHAVLIAAALPLAIPAAALAAPCRSEPVAEAVPGGAMAAAVRLLARHHVRVDEVCRDRRGLRFYAGFKADPRSGPNAGFYNDLFARLATMVGEPRVTLVDRDDALAITVERDARGDLVLATAPWPSRPSEARP